MILTYPYAGQATIYTEGYMGESVVHILIEASGRDTIVMPGRSRNPRLRKPLSLQVIKTWLELLDDTGTRWTYWDISQPDLTSLFDRYRICDCMDLTPPYVRSRSACEIFLRTAERQLSQSDLDENI